MKIDEHIFKQCLGCFATGVTVVTYVDNIGKNHGITINSFASLSLDPPLILFNLAKDSNNYDIFKTATKFTVNILSELQLNISKHFAFAKADKWQNIEFLIGKNNCPILDGIVAYIECDLKEQYDGGDHTIIIGEVTNLKKLADTKPLIYFHGKYNNLNQS